MGVMFRARRRNWMDLHGRRCRLDTPPTPRLATYEPVRLAGNNRDTQRLRRFDDVGMVRNC